MAPASGADRMKRIAECNHAIQTMVKDLSDGWSLGLQVPSESESPGSRGNLTSEQSCVQYIKMICYKDKERLFELRSEFESEAKQMYSKWVKKPRADRNVLVVTRHNRRPINEQERQQLLNCLLNLLKIASTAYPSTPRRRFISDDAKIDDSPLAFSLSNASSRRSESVKPSTMGGMSKDKRNPSSTPPESKRPREDNLETSPVKKARADSALLPKTTNSMLPPPPSEPSRLGNRDQSRSANTSFADSVFSRADSNSFISNTQDTIPDEAPALPQPTLGPAFTNIQKDKISSDYATSSFEDRVANVPEDELIMTQEDPVMASEDVPEELSQDLLGYTIDEEESLRPIESELKDSLKSVFPGSLPTTLENVPLCVLYEITRVFLHAGVPMSKFNAPISSELKNYSTLWLFLRSLPVLQGKSFPERCGEEVWACAVDNFQKGPYCVSFTGTLSFNPDPRGPIFDLRLEPLKLEFSHRLGRRFGHDRFMEVTVPELTGRHLPAATQHMIKQMGTATWNKHFYDWIVDTRHKLLGRYWKPFFVKPKDKTSKRRGQTSSSESKFRVFFFAIDGRGFIENDSLISEPNRTVGDPVIPISRLLCRVRPTRKNTHQSYLKLFNRTTLAVSRNQETVILESSQIRFRPDIVCKDEKGKDEVMNDGAGRISRTLAIKVMEKLGLSHFPSGFQGRLGEAKGFWLVDHTDNFGEDWIEVYPSQQKWERSTKPDGESDDRSHRVFEVLNHSKPLKSADLNTQLLPLLLDRATHNRDAMRDAIADLLRQGLAEEFEQIKAAMESPPVFKKWIRSRNSGISERLKSGSVPYRAGLPVTVEERLNAMLDAGFDPRKLQFMNNMARDVFKMKCKELQQRMNITIGRSTYAYMVPDFWGVLEEGEVYLDFSSFRDEISGFAGASLNGEHVLVARNPAHFISDIQKVKIVVRAELMGLKDVIVFPVKGNPSLASKLSGGDYDGDMAWVCWEPSIVDKFECAPVPDIPNLVEEGLLTRDKDTYEDLMDGRHHSLAVPSFLKKSFAFNMQPAMLGICTKYKEGICYAQGTVDSKAAVYLSQLLSCLVDQVKQGYHFDDDCFKMFKDKVIPKDLKSKQSKRLDSNWKPTGPSPDIIEHLLWVAHRAVNSTLAELKQEGSLVDDDLTARYNWMKGEAQSNPELKSLLDGLNQDLKPLKESWSRFWASYFARRSKQAQDETEELDPEFTNFIVLRHQEFMSIRPHEDNIVTRLLLCDDGQGPNFTGWELLKASALFASYGTSVRTFAWWLGGKQLCHMKAHRSIFGTTHSVVPGMYILQKPDNSIIRKLQNEGFGGDIDDIASVVNLDDVEDLEDD